jgi:hypothetical protein
METEINNQTNCCPKFNPSLYDEKEFIWQDKLFIKDSIPTFLHMPLPSKVGSVMEKLWTKAKDVNANSDEFLCLTHDPSAWKSEYYMAVSEEISGIENVKLTGTFLTKVFDGPYSAVPKWIKEMDGYLKTKGRKAKKYYFYYTTCPKCAKIYGQNYVVLFAEV